MIKDYQISLGVNLEITELHPKGESESRGKELAATMEDLSSSMAALKAEAKQTVEAKEAELASARTDGAALKGRLEEAEGKLKGLNSIESQQTFQQTFQQSY